MLKFFNKLKNSKMFKTWKRENKDFFLCGCFTMLGDKEDFWQFDFYSKEKGKITSFKVDEKIEIIPDDDVFSEDKDSIGEVDLKKVKFSIKDTLKKINKDYSGAKKKIIILQDNNGLIWNVTLLMDGTNVVNLKISAEKGKIIKEEKESLLNFKA